MGGIVSEGGLLEAVSEETIDAGDGESEYVSLLLGAAAIQCIEAIVTVYYTCCLSGVKAR